MEKTKKRLDDVDELVGDICGAHIRFKLGGMPFEEFADFMKRVGMEVWNSQHRRIDVMWIMRERLESGDLDEKAGRCCRAWLQRVKTAFDSVRSAYSQAEKDYEVAKAKHEGFEEGSAQFKPLWEDLKKTERELAGRDREVESLHRLVSAAGIDTQKNRELAMFMKMRQYRENHGGWEWLGDLALVQVFRGVDGQVGNDSRLGRINDAHQRLVSSDPELVARFRETFAGSSDDSIRTRYCAWRNAVRQS